MSSSSATRLTTDASCLKAVEGAGRALGGDDVVDACVLQECDRGLAVLGFALGVGELAAQRHRDVELEVRRDFERLVRVGRDGNVVGLLRQENAFVPALAEPARVERLGGRFADEHLAGLRGVFQPERLGGRRPRDHQLAVRALDEEGVDGAGVDAGRHTQRHGADRAHRAAGVLDKPLHLDRGEARALLVAVALEQEEQGVAAELEHVAAAAERDPDQALEDAADDEDELLRAGAALGREALREGGEPGEVDGDECPRQLTETLAGRLPGPVHDEAREVGAQP